MTRGKEVQDLIKENKKSARELFEEAGWKCNINKKFNCIEYIKYKEETSIYNRIFYSLDTRTISCEECYDAMDIDIDTFKLIIQQCKELGWL